MSLTAPPACVYTDFSEADYTAEFERVREETAIERQWTSELSLPHFKTDHDILKQAQAGRLLRVEEGIGYTAIQRLANWESDRSDVAHPFHYSPPYLRQEAVSMLGLIGHEWARDGSSLGSWYSLPVTSMIRSTEYQTRLAEKERKLTIDPNMGWSSHVFGLAFDIDGRGLYRRNRATEPLPVNSHDDHKFSADIERSRSLLRNILEVQKSNGDINYVEELPGTKQHIFHVCVKPHEVEPRILLPRVEDQPTLGVPIIE